MTDQPPTTHPLDDVRDSWRTRELGGGVDAFLAAASVLRLQRVMTQGIEAALRPFAVNLTDYLLLMTLELNDDGTRLISQLARSLVVHATTVTMATDRLEARGLLARTPHPSDRRATEVRITEDGRGLVHRLTGVLAGGDFGLVGATDDERRDLLDVVTRVRTAAGDATPPTSG